MRNYLVLGDWNARCDRCGFKFKASQLKDEWTGLKVCTGCWEPRHPQTLIKVPKESPTPPWARPESDDVFVGGDPLLTESGEYLYTEAFTIIITES